MAKFFLILISLAVFCAANAADKKTAAKKKAVKASGVKKPAKKPAKTPAKATTKKTQKTPVKNTKVAKSTKATKAAKTGKAAPAPKAKVAEPQPTAAPVVIPPPPVIPAETALKMLDEVPPAPEPEEVFLPWLVPGPPVAPEISVTPTRPKASILISFKAADAKDAWKASVFQESVKSYISPFSNLTLVEGDNAHADFKWTGTYQGNSVKYQLIDSASEVTLDSGSLRIADWIGARLQVQVLQIMKPIVKAGGLIDIRNEERPKVPPADGDYKILDAFLATSLGPFAALLAGVIWGILLLRVGRFCFGHGAGIHHISYSGLWTFLRSWSEVAAAKILAVLVVFGVPGWLAFRAATPALGSEFSAATLVLPLVALAVLLVLYQLNLTMTAALDLGFRKFTKNSPWDDKIRRYFINQQKRIGSDIPEYVLKRVRFGVHNEAEPYVFGGFGLQARILIPLEDAELALGAIPLYQRPDILKEKANQLEERKPMASYEMRSVIAPKELNPGKVRASDAAYEKFANKMSYLNAEHADPVFIGEQLQPFATQTGVWGYVLPNRHDKSVPLIADNSQDLEVVESLVNEHHLQYAKPQIEEVFDDSEPQHKDFLFGVLVREIGVFQRGETIFSTTALFVSRIIRRLPEIVQRWLDFIKIIFDKNFMRHPVFMADAFAELHNCGHHLVQYLYYLTNRRKHVLTSRSGNIKLSTRSHDIFARLKTEVEALNQPLTSQPTLLNRLIWLSRFYPGMISGVQRRRRRWFGATVLILLLLAVSMKLVIAVRYHPIYQEHIAKMNQAIEDYNNKENERGKGKVL